MEYECAGKEKKCLTLKADNERRPLWVSAMGSIILETSSEFYKEAADFCIAIAEPESRLRHFHEYKITPASLYGAASAGLDAEKMIKYLKMLCKTDLAPEIIHMIQKHTENVGKLALYLKDGSIVVEGISVQPIKTILPYVRDVVIEKISEKSFKIEPLKIEFVRQKCREINFPLVEIYDYKNDKTCPDLGIKLSPKAQLRPYQKKSVDKIFINGKARSGVIVLPCGAGKSLTGVYAAVRLGKPCLCFANTSVSVDQWVFQFKMWSTIGANRIQGITSNTKACEVNLKADILVTTYSMYGYTGHRSKDSEEIIKVIEGREWGLILMDEVHMVPARNFRDAVARTKSHCKVGLTATLLREDEAIQDLEFIIGPKVYEANWQELVEGGYLANVECYEVLCPMSKEYMREYLKTYHSYHGGGFYGEDNKNIQHTLYSSNPNKLMACEYLIKYHEQQRDKIIVFSDNLFSLDQIGTRLQKLIIRGETSHQERTEVIKRFKESDKGFTVLLSKVGDTSLDLPEATVVIQISSQGGSRRQEAQRLGRVLRPKPTKDKFGVITGGQAVFYSLVSQDTIEMCFASKRQQFLVNQGYTFTSMTNIPTKEESSSLLFSREDVQAQLLHLALQSKCDQEQKQPPEKKKKREHKSSLFKKRFK
ncbi:hypothetical protein SUGI_0119420 [Cryptomeria japonica]|uniref:general transcription and DNA repair factor IIH helicase subunit XPB1 isoform X1 n=1 Tax=Cryptomeria japonica TaxID=3369 RepID=UPI002408C3DE|nr:general transcription and DNA repair factor IIH helicase subunit XPB1 isoform X1 [Cryptomeria japonica]GLJ09975.1 hypothetical protein SUGI_0119420 [Cryptomeria japonica]